MKRLAIVTILLYGVYCDALGQKSGDVILGKWLKQPKKDLIIEMYKTRGQYNGKISWSKSADKPSGFIIIENLKYNTKSDCWEKGKIRDPNSSKVYSAEVKLGDAGNLQVRGYKGAKFVGTSRTFTRVKS